MVGAVSRLRSLVEELKGQLRSLRKLPNERYADSWGKSEGAALRSAHSQLLAQLRGLPPNGTKAFDRTTWNQGNSPSNEFRWYVANGSISTTKPISGLGVGEPSDQNRSKCIVIADDLGITLGSLSLRLYINGELQRLPGDEVGLPMGVLKLSHAGYRLRGSFDFEGPQPLGMWDERGFRGALDPAGIPLNNAVFRRFQQETGRGKDFIVFTDIIPLDLKELAVKDIPLPIFSTQFI
jgi:hypothetical protein